MTTSASPSIPVSWGELLDKVTILEIKCARIARPEARANVAREYALLRAIAADVMRRPGVASLLGELKAVNEELWDIEDDIREKEAEAQFGPDFISLARSVYKRNDRRADLKRAINLRLCSDLIEEKSYKANTPSPFADDPSTALIHG